MQRAFLTVDSRQIHYRVGGEGAPIVMLHPSPLSSAALLPLGTALARRFRVYALDTPGYGQSDPPDSRPASLDDYLPDFAAALDALQLGPVCLYGAATGAQLAIEFARRYPQRVALLVLDSAGHIPADECERVVHDYFPVVTPRGDGGHLATLWQMVRDLGVFFPWCDRRAARRIDRDLAPPAVLQSMLLDYLCAGERYDWAYRPAFHNERAERAQGVTVPTVLMRWEGSVVLRITDDLIAAGLPPNFRVLRLGPTMNERIGGLTDLLVAHYRAAPAPAVPVSAPPVGRFVSRYLETGGGQMHLRTRTAAIDDDATTTGSGAVPRRWRIGLMGPSGAAALFEPAASQWRDDLPIALIDLPGSGNSADFLPADTPLERHASVVAETLVALGATQVDLIGRAGGVGVAIEAALSHPTLVRHLTLDRSGLRERAARENALEHEPRDFTVRADGTHLHAAWSMLRDRRLWDPGYRAERTCLRAGEPDLDPLALQRELLELMKMGGRYASARAVELGYAHEVRLARVGCDVRFEPEVARQPTN